MQLYFIEYKRIFLNIKYFSLNTNMFYLMQIYFLKCQIFFTEHKYNFIEYKNTLLLQINSSHKTCIFNKIPMIKKKYDFYKYTFFFSAVIEHSKF